MPTSFAAEPALRGAGATFPAPLYLAWAAEYFQRTGVQMAYDPIGSGAGLERLARGEVDFAASDFPLSPAELLKLGAMQFPAVIGGVVPVVNMGGVASGKLRLTGQSLGDIYLGKVRKWNDPVIAASNPEISLPSENITVVHREDASGTTFLFSDFLARTHAEWRDRLGRGTVLEWPVGVAEIGNDGVASSVQRTRASIGYVEYAYAKRHGLGLVSMRNRAGLFVRPERAAFEAAAKAARWSEEGDLEQVLVDGEGARAWPITGASFIVVPRARAARSEEIRAFFDSLWRHGEGITEGLDYVPLPAPAVEWVRKRWNSADRGNIS